MKSGKQHLYIVPRCSHYSWLKYQTQIRFLNTRKFYWKLTHAPRLIKTYSVSKFALRIEGTKMEFWRNVSLNLILLGEEGHPRTYMGLGLRSILNGVYSSHGQPSSEILCSRGSRQILKLSFAHPMLLKLV